MSEQTVTRFHVCESHRGWLSGASHYRRGEIFCEGGPAHAGPCADKGCWIVPGSDLFCSSLFGRRYSTSDPGPFYWACNADRVPSVRCSCATHDDGSVTTFLCPAHAENDPCLTMARVTGRRRRGSIVRGVCSHCGWGSS